MMQSSVCGSQQAMPRKIVLAWSKAMVRVPPGNTIVVADVDSEELWISV